MATCPECGIDHQHHASSESKRLRECIEALLAVLRTREADIRKLQAVKNSEAVFEQHGLKFT